MKIANEFKVSFGSENHQNLNESQEILKQSFNLWKEFFTSLNSDRELSRLGRHARGHILRLLELNSARGVPQ